MDRNTVSSFFTALFRQVEPDKFINISMLDGKKMRQFWRSTSYDNFEHFIEGLTDLVIKHGDGSNVFISGALYEEKSRKAEKVVGIQGLWLDIDIGSVAHNKKDLPPDIDSALELLSKLPQPTLIIFSGHGLQVWYLFEEPWMFGGPEDHEDSARLSMTLNHALKMWAKTMEWSTDNVGDLSRLMRVPGSVNAKEEPFVPVEIIKSDGPYWTLDDLNRAITLPPNVGGYKTPEAPKPNGPIPDVAGSLIVAPGREPSAKLTNLLWKVAPKAKRIYDNKEFPTDNTKSGVDYTLASYAAKAGGFWTPQMICDLLIMRAEEHGFELKTQHYYQFTINRVFEYNNAEISHNEIMEDLKEARKSEGKTKDELAQQIHDKLERALGVKFGNRIFKLQARKRENGKDLASGKRQYVVTAEDGSKVTLLDSDLDSQKLVKAKLREIGIYIDVLFKTTEWGAIANDFARAAIEEWVSEEETEEGEIKGLLASWFLNTPKVDARSQIRMMNSRETSPFVWPEGEDDPKHIAFCNTAFKRHLKDKMFMSIEVSTSTLKSIGAINKPIAVKDDGKAKSLWVWLMPNHREEDEIWRDIAERMSSTSYRQTVKSYEELQERKEAPAPVPDP